MADHARGQPVEAVDEVDGVGHGHHPDHGDEEAEVGREDEEVGERDPEVEHRHARPGRGPTPASTWPATLAGADTSRRSSSRPTREDDGGGQHHAQRLRRRLEHGPELGQEPGHAQGREQGQEHGHPAQGGRGPQVDAALVGHDDRARCGWPDRHTGGRQDEGDERPPPRRRSRRRASLRRRRGGQSVRVGRELRAEGGGRLAHLGQRARRRRGRRRARPMRAAISAISGSPIPAVVTAAVPMRRPLVTNGERGSPGIWFLLRVIPARSRTFWASLPVSSASNGRRSTSMRWLSVPPETSRNPSPARASARARALAHDLGRVLPERRLGRLPEGDRLGRDDVHRAARPAGRGTPPCRWPWRAPPWSGCSRARGPRSVLWVVKVTTSA